MFYSLVSNTNLKCVFEVAIIKLSNPPEGTEMRPITRKQLNAKVFVRDFIATNKISPTYEEIAQGLSITIAAAHARVKELIARGHVINERNRPYSLQIVEAEKRA